MEIFVTQDHIDRGIKENGTCCPIALAIKEQTEFKNVFVSDDVIFPYGGLFTFQKIFTASYIQYFIGNFDDGEYVEPFSFELDLP
jgi:hypothetical protein